jgi:hypothetical protein
MECRYGSKFNLLQLVGGATDDGEQYNHMSSRLKTEGGSVQLLISSSDGSSITYSLDSGQTGYVEQLDTVLDTFKSQGFYLSSVSVKLYRKSLIYICHMLFDTYII